MEKMRPSAKRSTKTAMMGNWLMSSTASIRLSSTSCVASQIPSSPLASRGASSALRACQTGSGTMILPFSGITVAAICSGVQVCSPVSLNMTILPACLRTTSSTAGRVMVVHSLSTMALLRMRLDMCCLLLLGVYMLLERHDADAAHGVDKTLLIRTLAHIDLDQALYHARHFLCGKGASDGVAEAG